MRYLVSGLIAILGAVSLHAQDAATAAQAVQISAADGHTLHATYYPSAGGGRSVLLLHQLYTTRASWDDLIPALQSHGYAVLAPDLRGYGQTRGAINWREAQSDTVLWLAWLREQAGAGAISVIGSSMGANLAVIGCADANTAGIGCVSAVAISPGRNYFGYTPLLPALTGGMADRRVLFVTAEQDGYPALAAQQLPPQAPDGVIDVLWLAGNAHGIDLLEPATINAILRWLYGGAAPRPR